MVDTNKFLDIIRMGHLSRHIIYNLDKKEVSHLLSFTDFMLIEMLKDYNYRCKCAKHMLPEGFINPYEGYPLWEDFEAIIETCKFALSNNRFENVSDEDFQTILWWYHNDLRYHPTKGNKYWKILDDEVIDVGDEGGD